MPSRRRFTALCATTTVRGLIEPRCPECGSRYTWKDLFDPRRRKHPYLFEHHPERNWGSFWQTLRGGLRPKQFWQALHPIQPSNLRRLLMYTALVMVFLVCGACVVRFQIDTLQAMRAFRMSLTYPSPFRPVVNTPLDCAEYVLRAAWNRFQLIGTIRDLPLLLAYAWPFATFLTLMIFQASMRRARIKTVHVLRCVIYSADVLVWLLAAILIFKVAQFVFEFFGAPIEIGNHVLFFSCILFLINRVFMGLMSQKIRNIGFLAYLHFVLRILAWLGLALVLDARFEYNWHRDVSGFIVVHRAFSIPVVAAFFLIGVYRLITAYRLYLQFDRPIATVLASQLIVALVIGNVYLVMTLW